MRLLLDSGVLGCILIGAQAVEDDATIVTTNTKHFEALAVPTFEWAAVPMTEGTE